MNREVLSYQQRLDTLFSNIEKFSSARPVDDEILSHLAKYLCVIVCGFVEVSIRAIYSEYANRKAEKNVANFISNSLKKFQSPNMEKVLKLTGAFDPDWRDNLKKLVEGEIKDSIDSLGSNRNIIAHGGSVGITIRRVKRYYADAKKLVRHIEAQCNPC
jgi:hypothetical protein